MDRNYNVASFKKDLEELKINLTENQIDQFLVYYEMLVDWNQRMNLTAITEYDEVMKKHFVDSLSLVKAVNLDDICCGDPVCKLIDVGTGAGFPGLALKIAYPVLHVTLLDSLNKRILFLNEVIKELGLHEVEAVHGRAEDFAAASSGKKKTDSLREQYDLCVSRAVANLSTLSEYCLPFVKVGGKFISYKSEKITEEAMNAEKAISVLGGKVDKQVEFYLPDSDIYRNLFVIEKVKATPNKYPRKAGLPGKEPICS